MEKWEKNLRDKLNKVLPEDASYYIPEMQMEVGKESYIETIVAINKNNRETQYYNDEWNREDG